jgi:hypothetical protein
MPISLSIEPSDFVVPSGPVMVLVKVDRAAFQHLDPTMTPLTNADSGSTVKRKGKAAIEKVRRDLSVKLFGTDIPRSDISNFYRDPDFPAAPDSDGQVSSWRQIRYIGFHWKRDVPADGLSPAVVTLTSEPEPVDDCLRFHAVEITDEDGKDCAVGHILHAEARRRAEMEAEEAQAAPDAQQLRWPSEQHVPGIKGRRHWSDPHFKGPSEFERDGEIVRRRISGQ